MLPVAHILRADIDLFNMAGLKARTLMRNLFISFYDL